MNITLVVSSIATAITLIGAGIHWHDQQTDCGQGSQDHMIVRLQSGGSSSSAHYESGQWGSDGSGCQDGGPTASGGP